MRVCSICTFEYDVDIKKLLARRLAFTANAPDIDREGSQDMAEAQIENDTEMAAWCTAIAQLLMWDLSHFELARMVNELPVSLYEKQLILPEAINNARALSGFAAVRRGVWEHFKTNDQLNLEGFVRFRMKDMLSQWENCADRAAEELILRLEYTEMMNVLSSFVRIQIPKVKDISLILNPDGTCTLSDGGDPGLDYAKCTDEKVVGILIGLAPEQITVYDLSGGRNRTLAEALIRVFEDRVKFFS